MQLFYTADFSESKPILSLEESHHCIKVLRKQEGDKIYVTDGQGRLFFVEILGASPKQCLTKVLQFEKKSKTKAHRHIAIAPTKSTDRTAWFVEKSVEIGIDEISFVLCQNSERKHLKIGRLEKVAISAMKQSLRTFLPRLNDLTKFENFVELERNACKFIAHLEKNKKNRQQFKNKIVENAVTCVMIGPEGDFSTEEIAFAKSKSFEAVSLGEVRYRTETAGIIACHLLNLAKS